MVEPCNVSRNVAFGTEKFDELYSLMQAADEAKLEGAADADVPAEEGQAKERTWEVFTGKLNSKGRSVGNL